MPQVMHGLRDWYKFSNQMHTSNLNCLNNQKQAEKQSHFQYPMCYVW